MAYRTRPRFQVGVQRTRRDDGAQARQSTRTASGSAVLAAPAPRPETRKPRWNPAPLLDALVELHERQP